MMFKKTSIAFAAAALCGASFATQAATPAPTSGTLEIWWKAPASGATVSGVIQDTTCHVAGRGVTKVEFYLGSTLINTDTAMSNGMGCVLDTTKFANGSHTLTAVAYDSAGRTYREPRSIRIQNAISAPTTPTAPTTTTPTAPTTTTPTAPTTTVQLPAPSSGTLEIWTKAPVKGATVSGVLQGSTCYVAGRGASRVEFFIDNTRLNTDSVMSDGMSCVLDTTKVANGTHTLKAVAYNSSGSSYTELVPLTVRNTVTAPAPTAPAPTTTPTAPAPTPTAPAPTPSVTLPKPTTGTLEIWFKSPMRGATVSGQLALDKCYVAGKGVSRVEFFLDSTRLNTDTNMADGMSCVLDTTKFTNGTHSLKAVAYDSSGRSYPETTSINIQNAASAVNAAPTVSISSPASGATLSGTAAAYSASASDSDGTISKLEVFVGSTLVGTNATGTIDTTKLPNGAQTLMVVATDNKGATGTTQRSVTINNTATSNPGTSAPTSGAIDPAHIVQRASAEMAFSQQNGFNAQVIGQHLGIGSIPESGVHGTTLANGETMRFGKVVDPADSARKALMLQVHRNDPNTSGSKRTELRMGNNIEWDQTYWAAFSVYVYDWGTLTSSDQALYGIQLHSGDDSAGYSPSFAIYTVGNGRRFNIQARSPSGTQRYAEQDIPFGRWVDYVFKFKQNTSGTAFLHVWQDGVQIVNHTGNLGYKVTQKDYFKFGYYNWTGASSNNNARKVLLHAPTIVADPTGNTYSAEQLRALVAASSSSLAGGSSSSGGTTTSTGATASGGVCSTALCVVTQ